jgi:hypothetical protein
MQSLDLQKMSKFQRILLKLNLNISRCLNSLAPIFIKVNNLSLKKITIDNYVLSHSVREMLTLFSHLYFLICCFAKLFSKLM